MKTKFYCTILLIASIVSCSKDSDPRSNSVVGEWTIKTNQQFECTTSTDNLEENCPGFNFCGTWNFKNDGTYVISFTNGGQVTAEYTVANNHIALCAGSSCQYFTMQFSGTSLVLGEDVTGNCRTRYTFEKK